METTPLTDPWGRAHDDPLYGVMPGSPRYAYERLRERYAREDIDLEAFTAGVVSLLKEGL